VAPPVLAKPMAATTGLPQIATAGECYGATFDAQMMMNPARRWPCQKNATAQTQQWPLGGEENACGTVWMPGMGGIKCSAPVADPNAGSRDGKRREIRRRGLLRRNAKLGQGNHAGCDYSPPIRNAIVSMMSGAGGSRSQRYDHASP